MFDLIKTQVQKRFAALVTNGPLFQVELHRDLVWQTYISAIPEEHRQSNTCSCCKSFLRQYGGIVGIGPANTILTLWDFDLDDAEYGPAAKALRRYVASLPITGLFLNPFAKCGTDKNFDGVRGVTWTHFFVDLPKSCVKKMDQIGPFIGNKRENKNVLLRSVNELTPDSVETTLDLIRQGSLYRGAEFKGLLEQFQAIQMAALAVTTGLRENHCWVVGSGEGGAVTRIRNTAIGTLLIDLSAGMDLDAAVRAFERVVAPANYKRPTALVTPRMIEDARTRLQELGLVGSLERRLLSDRDLTAKNALHVFRKQGALAGDVFDQMKTATLVNPKSLSKVEEISIGDFIANVLPTAKSVKALVENSHLGNLVSLVGAVDPSAPTLFKWGNNFSWSYIGEVADSIKEKVKARGGNVEGFIRISLSWSNKDDLDMHVIEPGGYEMSYRNIRTKSPTGGMQDLDANGLDGMFDTPVENVFWTTPPTKGGVFKVVVNQYSLRESANTGFELEIECDGQIYNFAEERNGATGMNHHVATFTYTNQDGFQITGKEGKVGKYPSKEKWGLKTGVFVPVRAITLSPNHWTNAIGNKHTFFILEGAKNKDRARPFYNEFLKPELEKDRKVFEILGAKVEVAPTENELSGIGFSETVRHHLYVEVESAFKRTLKINF